MLTRSLGRLTLVALAACTPAAFAKPKLDLEFEANHGQFAPEVLFLARTPSHFVSLTRNGLTLGQTQSRQRGAALRMQLMEASAAVEITPENRLEGISNYFIGNEPSRWLREVPHFARVRYHEVWPGIDLVVRGRDQSLEYDFELAPDADPASVRLRYPNAGSLRLDAAGDLVIQTASGDVIQHLPEIYQERNGAHERIRGGFRIAGDEVRFAVGPYDRRRALVIDPTVTYSSYIGGSGTITVSGAAVDSTGNLYIAGSISSPDYPTPNAIQPSGGAVGLFRSANQGTAWGSANSSLANADVLALATDPSTPSVAYAGTSNGLYKTTNSGATWTSSNSGMGNASVTSVAVDPLAPQTLYACQPGGLYKSTDGANTWTSLGVFDCAVVAADSKTEGTIWIGGLFDFAVVSFDGGKTFFTAFVRFHATAVAIDPTNSNNIFYGTINQGLVRTTNGGASFSSISTGLVTTPGATVNVNAVAIDRKNTSRVLVGTDTGLYISFTAGSTFQAVSGVGSRQVLSVLYDPNNDNIALAGTAGGGVYQSNDGGQTWTQTGPANQNVQALAMSADEQSTFAALYTGAEAFVTKINPAGTSIVYSTYLGGSGTTTGLALAVDSAGHAFTCGQTSAADYPVKNAYQANIGGGADFFVTRLSSSGSSLDASTFLGGQANDSCQALALDPAGNVYVAGTTILLGTANGNSNFPATQGVFGPQSFGSQDCVISKFDNALQRLIYSTFFGGSEADSCFSIAADSTGNAYVTGGTLSSNFLVTQTPFGGIPPSGSGQAGQAFVAKVKPDASGLVYSALLGGNKGTGEITSVAADAKGRAYVTGYTNASDYPVTPGALSTTLTSKSYKSVVTAIETDGSKLVYSTYLSGSGTDYALNLALDANGTAWITGAADGSLPVTADALAIKPTSSTTPYLAAIDSTGAKLLHATYLGGSAGGANGPVVVGPDGSIYIVGKTLSTDFTLTGTPFGKAQSADFYAFLMRLVFPAGGVNPTIGSVQNGAGFQNGFPVNSWMTIKGTNLSSVAFDTWNNSIVNGHLPTSLDGVSVSVGGQAAYIDFVSPTQVNVVAPNVAAGPVNVVVTNGSSASQPFSTTAQTYQPAFFQFQNTAYVVATHQDFSYAVKNGTFASLPTVAAKPGDVIILWGAGFGPTNPAAPSGAQVPASSFPAASSVTVTVGDAPATVYGAALAPGFSALYQVAIQVPTSLANGDYAVVASVGGASSPATAMLTVQQ